MTTVPDRVKAHLRAEKPKGWCDRCTARALRLGYGANSSMAGNVTSALEKTKEFRRAKGLCSQCGQERKLTRAT